MVSVLVMCHPLLVLFCQSISLLLICPGFPESTVYLSEAPKGFYAQVLHGQVPAWLQPVKLPDGSPYRLWRRTN